MGLTEDISLVIWIITAIVIWTVLVCWINKHKPSKATIIDNSLTHPIPSKATTIQYSLTHSEMIEQMKKAKQGDCFILDEEGDTKHD